MYNTSQQPAAMQERYKLLPEELKSLFEYGTVDVVMSNILREFGLREDEGLVIQMEVELVLYLIMPRSGFIDRLQDSLKIEKSLAEAIYQKVNNDLFIIVDDVLEFAEKQFSEATREEKPIAIVIPEAELTSTNEKGAELSKKPKLEQVKPLRTFAMDVDMSRAHGYGAFQSEAGQGDEDEPVHSSNQDDILKK